MGPTIASVNRLWTALLATATIVVLGGVVYVLSHNPTVPQAGQIPGYTAPSFGVPSLTSTSPTTTPSATGSAHAAVSSNPESIASVASTVIAFVGDDYTHGVGGSGGSKTFPSLVGASLHVHDESFYLDDAGYAKTDADGNAYGYLVSQVIAAHPDIVVVTGGRNDRADDPSTLTSKSAAFFSALRAGLPQAKIIAVAAWWGDSPQPAVLEQVDAAVNGGVTAAGGTYLDLPDPLFGHSDWMSDDADPNDQGYAAIAASLEPKLKALLPT